MRIKQYMCWPDTVCGTAVMEYGDGREARVAWLRLPSWGYEYDYRYDAHRWGQRVLLYHGWHGFRIEWRFPVTDNS